MPLMLLALLFVLAGGVTVSAADKRKYVFVGDSYGVVRSGSKYPWPKIFQELLNIRKSQVIDVTKGAHGFAKPGKQFITRIRTIPKDPEVTDIIVMGGLGNDWLSGGVVWFGSKAAISLSLINLQIARMIPAGQNMISEQTMNQICS